MEDYEKEEIVTDELDDDEELDLIKLVSANANDTSQYLIFVGSDNQYYAKNVSKIEELLVYKDIQIAKNQSKESLVVGTADIRGNMTTIVNFDKWFGNEVLDDSEYELIVLAHYGGHRLGIVVKRVEYIVNIPSDTMTDNSENNELTSFITKVQVGSKKELCLIFDSDKMLLDVFNTIDAKAHNQMENLEKMSSEKLVLFADDSRFIRKMAEDLFLKMSIKYRIYDDGQQLIDDLPNIKPEDISLFITDLEMPCMGGREVIDIIRKNKDYSAINLIVHTNMSNDNMESTLLKSGAQSIIGKVDMLRLSEAIKSLMV
ncbi:MAG: chemotaxis protein CheW [Campylobacterota bacterium]|nr:chemotaxis protein CheW [Campylobacterota bacterium]